MSICVNLTRSFGLPKKIPDRMNMKKLDCRLLYQDCDQISNLRNFHELFAPSICILKKEVRFQARKVRLL